MGNDYLAIHFDDQGHLLYEREQQALLHALLAPNRPITDVWIFSHGWRTDQQNADELYSNWSQLMRQQMTQEAIDAVCNPLFIGIYWPSLGWSEDIPTLSISPSLSFSLLAPSSLELGAFELGTEGIASRSEGDFFDPTPSAFEIGVSQDIDLSPRNESTKDEERSRFIEAYRLLLNPANRDSEQCKQDFGRLYDIAAQSADPTAQQIEEFVTLLYRYKIDDPHSDASEHTGIWETPERAVVYLNQASVPGRYEASRSGNILDNFIRLFTFWAVKARAAIVGQSGVAPFLFSVKQALQEHNRRVRLHLMGHSFGAKLVSAAVYGLNELMAQKQSSSPPLVDNLILVLGAFSQFAFCPDLPFQPGSSGKYAPILERRLVANPLVVIYSQYDLANTFWYPWGMFLSRSGRTYERGGPEDRLGALGANGAQGLDIAICHGVDLQPLEAAYNSKTWRSLSCLNIDGQHYINAMKERSAGAHGDIYRPEIFHLALALSRS
jgi:hypothetical protein